GGGGGEEGGGGKDINGSGQLTLVRVVQDLPPFVGADGRTYRLKSEDLVMLPKTNVDSLVKRGAAVPLAPGGR
ncbi:MAG: hypothetical protein HY558_03110, partial [Euryarchaeota archaeon]|nr:hypothetical protein [Euryarchaeota archaeon]